MSKTNLITIINDADAKISKLLTAESLLSNDSGLGKFNLCFENKLYSKRPFELDNEFNNLVILNHTGFNLVNSINFIETIRNLSDLEDIDIIIKVPEEDDEHHMAMCATYGLCPIEWGGDYTFVSNDEDLIDEVYAVYFYNFYSPEEERREKRKR